jgi:tRNA-Thr(GGU) m(6)t(6)A37 methyltransferase TsaA
MKIEYEPIGIIHTGFKEPKNMPIQPGAAKGIKGTVEIFPAYEDGLTDLAGFSHLILLFHLHHVKESKLKVVPFLDSTLRGVFATRAPSRPNSIGLSLVKLNGIEGCTLHIENVDMVDGTPLLDIKPYVSDFDEQGDVRIGWLEKKITKFRKIKSDDRFE